MIEIQNLIHGCIINIRCIYSSVNLIHTLHSKIIGSHANDYRNHDVKLGCNDTNLIGSVRWGF